MYDRQHNPTRERFELARKNAVQRDRELRRYIIARRRARRSRALRTVPRYGS